MYNRKYKKCCCQKNYDTKIIESACNDCGVTADFYTATKKDTLCDCGFDKR